MAKISKPPVPLKMYRHFATVTIILTAIVALLADGENRQAVEQYAAQNERSSDSPWVKRDKAEEPQLARREPYQPDVAGDFSDTEGGYGSPMVQHATGTVNSSIFGSLESSSGRQPIAGYTQAYLDSLSEEEYSELLEGLREAGMLDPQKRKEQIEALQRASRARSGAATQTY